MNVWRVRVDCLRINGKKQKVVKKTILVEANWSEDAKVAALSYLESHPDVFGEPWHDMEWRETAFVILPLELP